MDAARKSTALPGHKLEEASLTLGEGRHGQDPFARNSTANGPESLPLSTTEFPATRSSVPGTRSPRPPAGDVPVWLLRVWVVIRVAFFIELGMVLVALPWTHGWTENNLLLGYPTVQFLIQNNFVRGLISGFGFVDIGYGIMEAVRYKEAPRQPTRS